MAILLSILVEILSFYTTNAIPCDFSQYDKDTIKYGLKNLEVPIVCNLYPSKENESRDIGEDNNYIRKKYDKKLSPREVFLTFDDGPSTANTRKILEVLKKYDVKATFFVIGKYAEQYPDIIKKIKEEGMCIAPHTYSHDYKIYRSEDTYFEDYEACCNAIMRLTGSEIIPYLRLPGGSAVQVSNKAVLKNIKTKLNNNKIKYVDWNVSSADAAMETVPTALIKNNVIIQCRGKKFVVILMHDSNTKTTTVEALPEVIEYLKSNGYAFKTFDDVTISEERQMNRLQIINRY